MQRLNFIITGAGRGIGRGLSRELARKGHNIYMIDNNWDELPNAHRQVKDAITGSNSCAARICDITKLSDIEDAVSEARALFDGHLDCLINNAAVASAFWSEGKTMETVKKEEWDRYLATNLTGPFIMSQACLPMLKKTERRKNGGCIINMSSTRSKQSEENSEGYASTKAGLLGLTHSMAISLGKMGIRVNAILPGWINVDNEKAAADKSGVIWEDGLRAEDHEWHPAGRVGQVDDILRAVQYLVESKFVTGTETIVDGGVTKKMVYPE